MKEVMLTTQDNPHNPFTDFTDWLNFDLSMNYNTCAYLARLARTSDDLSDENNAYEIEKAIDEIVTFNLLGIYKKVVRDS